MIGNLLLGLHGPAGCGKDTLANVLVAEYGFKRIAFADALRKMAYDIDPVIGTLTNGEFWHYAEAIDLLGYEHVKRNYPEARRFLQKLGTEGVRGNIKKEDGSPWPDYWVDQVRAVLNNDVDSAYVITDVRFPNECEMTRELEGFVVHMHRPGLEKLATDHISEVGLEFKPGDLSFINWELADMKMAADVLLNAALNP